MILMRLLAVSNKFLAVTIVMIVTGTSLAFGGNVWWARPALAILTTCLLLAFLIRSCLMGRWVLLRSPLSLFWGLAILLAVVQLTPMPGRIASMVSSRSRAAHALGTLPELARQDDPDVVLPDVVADRTPATLDRSATLRWVVGAAGCLALFCVCSHYSDRIGHSTVIWGSVIAAFFLMTAFGLVQFSSRISGLYGGIEPGSGRPGMPSLDDLAASPGTSVLRPIASGVGGSWSLSQPRGPFQFGSMMGGAGAYLAMASLALPLALGLSLQMMAPRGSRQPLLSRLRDTGGAGMLIMMILMTTTSAAVVGYLSGPILAVPFLIGIAIVGLPGAWASGLRWISIGLTCVTLLAMGAGIVAGDLIDNRTIADPMASAGLTTAKSLWVSASHIARDFPILGSGLGTFSVISPYYKTRDVATNTAGSTLFQWWAESGAVGLTLLGLSTAWVLWRIPRATSLVQSGDRTLAFMMIGTAACFAGFSLIHWSVELIAVAVAACAVAGPFNRWLAGGTDLFVEAAT